MRTSFDEYATAYKHAAMTRTDGVLEVTLHSDGAPLVWGDSPHSELGYCFADIGADPDNRVVILTGAGDRFCADLDTSWVGEMTPEKWSKIYHHGRRLLQNLLEIEIPVIAAVNGPARVHAELAVLSDIVLASTTADFQDSPHFKYGTVPSDGVHLVWPLLLGPNRGRYFLLTSQRLSATEAYRLGVVSEVLDPHDLLSRARTIARKLAAQPSTTLRYTRAALTQQLKESLLSGIGYGLALEGLAAFESWPT
jgi:enoyl-CoA hydratase/carnithine racemase